MKFYSVLIFFFTTSALAMQPKPKTMSSESKLKLADYAYQSSKVCTLTSSMLCASLIKVPALAKPLVCTCATACVCGEIAACLNQKKYAHASLFRAVEDSTSHPY